MEKDKQSKVNTGTRARQVRKGKNEEGRTGKVERPGNGEQGEKIRKRKSEQEQMNTAGKNMLN